MLCEALSEFSEPWAYLARPLHVRLGELSELPADLRVQKTGLKVPKRESRRTCVQHPQSA